MNTANCKLQLYFYFINQFAFQTKYIKEFLPGIFNKYLCILGQRGGHTDWEHLLKTEIDAGQEGRKQKQFIIKPFKENQRPFGSESNAIPYRRHNVLFWLWINATASTYPSGSEVLCWLWNSCEYLNCFQCSQLNRYLEICLLIAFNLHLDTPNVPVALHVPHVSVGCIHTIVPSGSRYYQPLQITAGTVVKYLNKKACNRHVGWEVWRYEERCPFYR